LGRLVNAVIIVLLLSQPALGHALDKYALDNMPLTNVCAKAGACYNNCMTGPVSGPEFWAASKETCNKQNL